MPIQLLASKPGSAASAIAAAFFISRFGWQTAWVIFGVIALLVNIMERKEEARNPFYRVVELTDTTEDPVMWGSNFPLQYDAYKRTTDQVRTRFGGSEAIQRTPTKADPRSVVAQSRLDLVRAEQRRVTRRNGGSGRADGARRQPKRAHLGRRQYHHVAQNGDHRRARGNVVGRKSEHLAGGRARQPLGAKAHRAHDFQTPR